jgi:hypothetical protein
MLRRTCAYERATRFYFTYWRIEMINFPIKGKGLKSVPVADEGSPRITNSEGWRVVDLHFLAGNPNKNQIASEIAFMLQDAAAIGFEQGIESIRVALGVHK